MTYHHIRTPAQHFTPGADEKRANCADRPAPFDALVDHSNGPLALAARRRVLSICHGCPIGQECYDANRNEPWMLSLRGIPWRERPRQTPSPSSLQRVASADYNRAKAAERNAARKDEVRRLIDQGAGLDDVLRVIDMSLPSFNAWCRRNGWSGVYHRLVEGRRAAA